MIRNVSPSSEIFLVNLNRLQKDIDRLQQQISSGIRISTASDAPDEISLLLSLRAQQAQAEQAGKNLQRGATEVGIADDALQTAIRVLDRAITLGSQAVGSTVSADQRSSMAVEAQGIEDQVLALTNTRAEGRYIFGGDRDWEAPYQPDNDPASLTGTTAVNSAPATRLLQAADGQQFVISKTAQEIFDSRDGGGNPAPDNVFAALHGLTTALQNSDTAGLQQALLNLRQASQRLNATASYYGAQENRIKDAQDAVEQLKIRLARQISDHQDADMAATATQWNEAYIQQQAAMTGAARRKPSLFDYMD